MMDDSLTPQDASTGTQRIPLLPDVVQAEYRCPICDVVVVRIKDGVVRFARSHVSLGEDGEGHDLLFLYHQGADHGQGSSGDFHPPHPEYLPHEKGPSHFDSGDFHPPHTVERPE